MRTGLVAGQGDEGVPEGAGATPHARDLLAVWEDGRDASPGERGLMLLRLAAPGLPDADHRSLTVGRRDALLLRLFTRLFGATAAALAACQRCGEELEFDVPLAAISLPAPATPPARYVLAVDGLEIAFRLPCAGDLAALGAEARDGSVGTAAFSLAERCVVAIFGADGAPSAVGLAAQAADVLEAAIAARVAEADAQAVVMLAFDCPSCAARWRAPFDIVEFLWRRLDVLVRALLRDVHILASTYGWSERDIVALTPWRRRHYIELIGA